MLVKSGTNSGKYYSHNNHLYSVEALTNASGSVVERYRYDAYGKVKIYDALNNVRANSIYGNRTGFTGRYLDYESRLWYFRARYFDSRLGRFINRDPLKYVDGMSMYSGYFVPVSLDPSGLVDINCIRKVRAPTNTPKVGDVLPWYYDCEIVNDGGTSVHKFKANDTGTNSESTDPNNAYGKNGPVPPGSYPIVGGTSSIAGTGGTDVPSLKTPNGDIGNGRTLLRIHPKGPNDLSEGCITTSQSDYDIIKRYLTQSLSCYGLNLNITEEEPCIGGKCIWTRTNAVEKALEKAL